MNKIWWQDYWNQQQIKTSRPSNQQPYKTKEEMLEIRKRLGLDKPKYERMIISSINGF